MSKKKTTRTESGSSRKASGNANAEAAVIDQLDGPDRIYKFADQLTAEVEEKEAVKTGPEPIWETWVTFHLADEVFAFTVETVHEIIRVGTVTRVPHAPHAVRGIANLRGRVVPVVDLRVRIGLPAADPTTRARILITKTRDRVLGLLVDSVEQVTNVDRNQVKPPPSDVMTEQSQYIVGVTHVNDDLLILLDPEEVLMIQTGLVPDEAIGVAS